MTLDQVSLQGKLERTFTGGPEHDTWPVGTAEAGAAWAEAYRSYASAATAGTTVPGSGSLDDAQRRLAAALGDAFAVATKSSGTAAAVIEVLTGAMAAGFVSFWLEDPVVFKTPTTAPLPMTGAVTAAVPGTLAGALATTFLGSPPPDAAGSAQRIAAALHMWTGTVTVTNVTVSVATSVVTLT